MRNDQLWELVARPDMGVPAHISLYHHYLCINSPPCAAILPHCHTTQPAQHSYWHRYCRGPARGGRGMQRGGGSWINYFTQNIFTFSPRAAPTPAPALSCTVTIDFECVDNRYGAVAAVKLMLSLRPANQIMKRRWYDVNVWILIPGNRA